MLIKKLPEFDKEFKKLSKKYPSLESDFRDFENALVMSPKDNIPISWLGKDIIGEFYKVKKFRCESITRQSQNSWIRIVYNYLESENRIELTYIEIYQKNKKSNHDIERIMTLFKK